MAIQELVLHCFRSHQSFKITLQNQFVVIAGANGAGKTNILEAISLLAPGKGLRGCNFEQIFTKAESATNAWAVSCKLPYEYDYLTLSTGCTIEGSGRLSRRIIKINDEVSNKHAEVLNYLRIIWLTPQTEQIFIEGASIRRKFVDRMTYNFFPYHAQDILNYDKLTRTRAKILQEMKYDELWVTALEKQLAELNYKIAMSRKNCIDTLSSTLKENRGEFLKPNIKIIGKVDEIANSCNLDEHKAIEQIQHQLKANRRLDGISSRTNFGIHKSDLEAFHPIKNISAQQCSTGEQKAMLLSLILAQAKAIKKVQSVSLILLLDEVFAHLDSNFRRYLIDEMALTNTQVWITSANQTITDEITYPKDLIQI